MDSDFDKRIEEIFHAALERPPGERTAFLDSTCAGDPSVRPIVEALLAADLGAERFLGKHARDLMGLETARVPTSSLEGRRVGQFQVIRLIGRGGMGSVYEAIQDDPRRKVALKVMRAGIASQDLLKRFRHEAQVLARLRHPGIAHVYEAGVHREGDSDLPYFAMEYIPDSKTIIEFASSRMLDTRERLDLFARVCDAVHHGHQRGVIHRDLKPSNILVDAAGQAKVIDFGVARATDADIAATTILTDPGSIVGTLQYMSPEQCDGDAQEIDTRSDVYGLGVVLYELICGTLPYDVGKSVISQAVRIIKEEAPRRPSSIHRMLRGDVETITLKALEKDRDRRYPSAANLAEDLRRYLRNEPIAARPPSAMYHLRKLVGRHKAPFALLASLFVVLAVFAGVTAFQARRIANERDIAESERDKAQEINAFLQDILAGADPEILGHEVTGKQLLDRAAALIEEKKLAGRPEVEVAVRNVIASAYAKLGQYADAERQWRAALAVERGMKVPDDARSADLLTSIGLALHDQRRSLEAEPLLREALQIERKHVESGPASTSRTLQVLGLVLKAARKFDEAEKCLLEAIQMRQEPTGREDLADLLNGLGTLYYDMERLGDALSRHREGLEMARSLLPPGHIRLAKHLNNTANVLLSTNDRQAAAALWNEALETFRKWLPPDHPHVATALINIALVHEQLCEFQEAAVLLEQGLEIRRKRFGEDNPAFGACLSKLAWARLYQGKMEEAEKLFRDALEIQRRKHGDASLQTAGSRAELAFLLLDMERDAEAEKEIAEVLRIQRKTLPPEHPGFGGALLLEGKLRIRQRRLPEAEESLRGSIEIRRKAVGESHWQTAYSKAALGQCLALQGRREEAETLLAGAHPILRDSLSERHPRTLEALERMVELYDAWGKPEKAEEFRRKMKK